MMEAEKRQSIRQMQDYIKFDLMYKIIVFGGLEEWWYYEMGDIWAD